MIAEIHGGRKAPPYRRDSNCVRTTEAVVTATRMAAAILPHFCQPLRRDQGPALRYPLWFVKNLRRAVREAGPYASQKFR